jgi:hypothetical protein
MSPAVFSIRIRIRFSGIYGMMGAGMQVPEQTAEKIKFETFINSPPERRVKQTDHPKDGHAR